MTDRFEIVFGQHVATRNIQQQHERDGTRVYLEGISEVFPLRAGLQLVEVLVIPHHAAQKRHCTRRWSDVGKHDAWVPLEVVFPSSLYVFLVLETYKPFFQRRTAPLTTKVVVVLGECHSFSY